MNELDIQKMMWAHGWLPLDDELPLDNQLCQYKKSIIAKEYETLCIAEVCEDSEGMNLSGEFGILWIECIYSEHYATLPYTYNDLYDMLAAMEMAEDDLLVIGIPFCARYQFHGRNAANKKRRNDALRRKYQCDEIEKELNNQRVQKWKQEQERRKSDHENNVE